MNNTDSWNAIRNYVLRRDKNTCTYCGWVASKDKISKLHIHHVIPWIECRSHDPTNLIVLCVYCHTLYTSLKQHNKLHEFSDKIRRMFPLK